MTQKRIVEVRQNILSENDAIAAETRAALEKDGVVSINLTSSPGSGKTTLLVKTIERLKGRADVAVIEGDQQTDNDARKIEGTGAPVVQVNTGSACHLDARMVRGGLERLRRGAARMLFIENVGNLVCPASYDLGETMKVVLLSVTEGEDKPLKYPKMFRVSSAMVITKTDLLPHVDFDVDRCVDYALKINPSLKVFRLSARTGEGMDSWVDHLISLNH